jgi:hypothetical protein
MMLLCGKGRLALILFVLLPFCYDLSSVINSNSDPKQSSQAALPADESGPVPKGRRLVGELKTQLNQMARSSCLAQSDMHGPTAIKVKLNDEGIELPVNCPPEALANDQLRVRSDLSP